MYQLGLEVDEKILRIKITWNGQQAMFFPGLNACVFNLELFSYLENWKQITLYSVAQKVCSTTIIGYRTKIQKSCYDAIK
jgi:hypothetical protein